VVCYTISDLSLDSFFNINKNNSKNKNNKYKDNNYKTNKYTTKKYNFKEKNVKTLLNKSKESRSIFLGDYSLNPYLGCSFDCEYCYINGSKYANSTNSFYIKSNASDILKTQLKNKAKAGERAVLLIGSATDPYIDIEKELFLTRNILNLANRFKFPVHIVTKSNLIVRDIDILKKIEENAILPKDIDNLSSKVIITFSFSTIDEKISKLFEPNAPTPKQRLEAMKKLKKENFLLGVSLMPVLPFISDTEEVLKEMFHTFKDINVDYIFGGSLSLFGEADNDSKTKYYKILKENFPDLVEPTKELFGNKDYPIVSYQNKVYKRLLDCSKKYSIRNKII
jgi:DNA repair photolyase